MTRERHIYELERLLSFGGSMCHASKQYWKKHKDEVLEAVKNTKEGEWIIHPNGLLPEELTIECSVCHEEQPGLLQSFWIDKNFCPNCGARMLVKSDENHE